MSISINNVRNIIKEQKNDNAIKDRIGMGRTTLCNFHSCICGHQDVSHIPHCKYCARNSIIKCEKYRKNYFSIVINFSNLEIDKEENQE